jgi:hypothetical protein
MVTILSKDSDHQRLVQECWQRYKSNFNACLKAHGSGYTLILYKNAYQFLVSLNLKMIPTPIPFQKVDRNGLPKVLWPIRPLISRGTISDVRLTMCIARVFQLIKLPIDSDLSKITDPGTVLPDNYLCSFRKYCKDWFSRINLSKSINTRRSKAYATMKAGPNGHALVFAAHDLMALRKEPQLLNELYKLNSYLGNQWINVMMEKNVLTDFKDETSIHSRLGFSSEGGGKTRIFAIGDYWSQMTLRPIHDALMAILKSLETDGTYDQEEAFRRILNRSKGHKTFCFDLSGASDRIPLKVQEIMMSELFSPEIANSWARLVSDREFHHKYGDPVKWKVGQPLGLLSSWGSFALWHHIIIEYCAAKVGIKSFRDYAVLGDDVVIWNSSVAVEYQKQMKFLGIPINLTKSVTGDSQHSQIEFAKRHARDGIEISGISYNLLNKNSLRNVDELICEVNKRSMMDDAEHCCRILIQHPNSRIQDLLNFIISLRLSKGPIDLIERLPEFKVDVDLLDQKVREKRHERIMEKVMDLDKILSGATPIENLFKVHKVQYNENALGIHGYSDPMSLHPLVFVVNHLGERLAETLELVWTEQTDAINELEYLPIIPNREFFYNSKTASRSFFTTILIDSYQELKRETDSN